MRVKTKSGTFDCKALGHAAPVEKTKTYCKSPFPTHWEKHVFCRVWDGHTLWQLPCPFPKVVAVLNHPEAPEPPEELSEVRNLPAYAEQRCRRILAANHKPINWLEELEALEPHLLEPAFRSVVRLRLKMPCPRIAHEPAPPQPAAGFRCPPPEPDTSPAGMARELLSAYWCGRRGGIPLDCLDTFYPDCPQPLQRAIRSAQAHARGEW